MPIPKFSRVVLVLHNLVSTNDLRARVCPIACRNLQSIQFSTAILCTCRFAESDKELFHNSSFSPFSSTGELDGILAGLQIFRGGHHGSVSLVITKLGIDNVTNFSWFNFRVRSLGIIHGPHEQ